MPIAFLTSEYPHHRLPKSIGGIGSSISALAKGLIEQGHKVTLFIIHHTEDNIFFDGEIKLVTIRTPKCIGLSWWCWRRKAAYIINQHAKEEKIDLLESPDWCGFTAFMRLDIPVIIKIHGSDRYFCYLEGRKSKWRNQLFERLALRKSNAIIGVSHFAAELTQKIFSLQREIEVKV